jgi:hypothetical protein
MANQQHAITIKTKKNVPDPAKMPTEQDQEDPTPEHPWECSYPCTVPGHTDTIDLLWDGTTFSLSVGEQRDPNFGEEDVNFTYDPPLTA